jgi:hypothetical protein
MVGRTIERDCRRGVGGGDFGGRRGKKDLIGKEEEMPITTDGFVAEIEVEGGEIGTTDGK